MHTSSLTGDRHAACIAGGRDHIIPGGAVDNDGVSLAVATAAAGNGSEIQVNLSHVSVRQIADCDGVGAALGGKVDLFDAVEIHSYAGDITEKEDARAVGGDINVLANI